MSPAARPAPRGCTHFKTRQLARLLARHYDAELAAAGLKTTQFSLLNHVRSLGPVAPGELARAMGLDASTLTRNLQPLLAAGWLVQGEGPDARTRSIHLTAGGRAKLAEAQRCWKQAQTGLQGLLGADRVAALHELLDDCTQRLSAPDAA
ncbi:MAG: MarR family winged helix-turn-helix transcriptional regulator [Rubrivivax sp.]